jgi:hypothetical protein
VISVLRPSPTAADPITRSPALFREGLSSARRELRAGTARRHRADVAPADAPVPPDPAPDLVTQRVGVRAALAELRQHRGPDEQRATMGSGDQR